MEAIMKDTEQVDEAMHMIYDEEFRMNLEENPKTEGENLLEKLYNFGFEMFGRGFRRGLEVNL
jgi:hypothetical protein